MHCASARPELLPFPLFDPALIKVYLQFFDDFSATPIAKKLSEIVKLYKESQKEKVSPSMDQTISKVIEANKCNIFKYRRRVLWGLYEKREERIKLC